MQNLQNMSKNMLCYAKQYAQYAIKYPKKIVHGSYYPCFAYCNMQNMQNLQYAKYAEYVKEYAAVCKTICKYAFLGRDLSICLVWVEALMRS